MSLYGLILLSKEQLNSVSMACVPPMHGKTVDVLRNCRRGHTVRLLYVPAIDADAYSHISQRWVEHRPSPQTLLLHLQTSTMSKKCVTLPMCTSTLCLLIKPMSRTFLLVHNVLTGKSLLYVETRTCWSSYGNWLVPTIWLMVPWCNCIRTMWRDVNFNPHSLQTIIVAIAIPMLILVMCSCKIWHCIQALHSSKPDLPSRQR